MFGCAAVHGRADRCSGGAAARIRASALERLTRRPDSLRASLQPFVSRRRLDEEGLLGCRSRRDCEHADGLALIRWPRCFAESRPWRRNGSLCASRTSCPRAARRISSFERRWRKSLLSTVTTQLAHCSLDPEAVLQLPQPKNISCLEDESLGRGAQSFF